MYDELRALEVGKGLPERGDGPSRQDQGDAWRAVVQLKKAELRLIERAIPMSLRVQGDHGGRAQIL